MYNIYDIKQWQMKTHQALNIYHNHDFYKKCNKTKTVDVQSINDDILLEYYWVCAKLLPINKFKRFELEAMHINIERIAKKYIYAHFLY